MSLMIEFKLDHELYERYLMNMSCLMSCLMSLFIFILTIIYNIIYIYYIWITFFM